MRHSLPSQILVGLFLLAGHVSAETITTGVAGVSPKQDFSSAPCQEQYAAGVIGKTKNPTSLKDGLSFCNRCTGHKEKVCHETYEQSKRSTAAKIESAGCSSKGAATSVKCRNLYAEQQSNDNYLNQCLGSAFAEGRLCNAAVVKRFPESAGQNGSVKPSEKTGPR